MEEQCTSLKEYTTAYPEIKDTNKYILTGYRPHSCAVKCIDSTMEVHNETINIWTHGFGAMFFLTVTVLASITYAKMMPMVEYALTIAYLSSVTLYMFLSTAYHTFNSYSPKARTVLSKLDWIGIIILMVASDAPVLYYSFKSNHTLLASYSIAVISSAVVAIAIVTSEKTYNNARLRSATFLILVSIGLAHVVHVYNICPTCNFHVLALQSFVFYGIGYVFFATKFPECVYPGKVDIAVNSHQIWHMCVVVAAILHFISIMTMYRQAQLW